MRVTTDLTVGLPPIHQGEVTWRELLNRGRKFVAAVVSSYLVRDLVLCVVIPTLVMWAVGR